MPNTPPTIQLNSSGDDVRWAQYLLVRRLVLNGAADVDGAFGPQTETAVKEFQQSANLAVDGVVGPQTWTALMAGYDHPSTLIEGVQDALVARLQAALNEGRGSFAPASDPVLATDGIYGPITKGVVEAVQGANAATVDGIVGLQTWSIKVHAANQVLAGVCQA